MNPTLDNSWKRFSRLDLVPETRLAYKIDKVGAIVAVGIIRSTKPRKAPGKLRK